MEEQHHAADDQSHYEISLTAGQAFVAFVLLLLSLAASFAFGLMIGKGQADDRLVVQRATPVVTEGALLPAGTKKPAGEIVELGVADNDFTDTAATDSSATSTDSAASATIIEESAPPATETTAAPSASPPASAPAATPNPAPVQNVTTYAQLLSTSDQKTAEALAVRLIERGFTSAYVERGTTDKGPIYRVRVKFNSEGEARAAEPKLRELSKEVWITSR